MVVSISFPFDMPWSCTNFAQNKLIFYELCARSISKGFVGSPADGAYKCKNIHFHLIVIIIRKLV